MNTDARLAVPAVVGWLILLVVIGFSDLLAPLAAVSWCLAGTLVAVALAGRGRSGRGRRWLGAAVLVSAVVALLLTSAAVLTATRRPPVLVDAAGDGRFVSVTAIIDEQVQEPVEGAKDSPVSATVTAATVGSAHLNGVAIPVLLFGDVPKAGIGSAVSASGTMVSAEDGERVQFLLFAERGTRVIADPPWFLDWANTVRNRFRAVATGLPGDGGALLPGLAIGDTSAVDAPLAVAMKSTSLSHLTAVSGANCAVIVGLVMLGGAAIGLSARTRIAVALLALGGFVILVTPEASVLRAAVMAAVVLGALASGRPVSGLPVLAFAVVALLTVDPWLCRDFGFILSVFATAGLLLLARGLAAWLGRWMPYPLAVVVSIPLAAQLACQPVIILLNPSIPLYGVLANLLAGPAAPVATVLGLLGCAMIPLVEPLGFAFAALAWLPSSWIAAVARFLSAAPAAQLPWFSGALGAASLAIVTGLVLMVILRPKFRASRSIAGAMVLCLVIYLGVAAGIGMGRKASIPAQWQIAACDIGQGDAVLVRSAGRVALVDVGPDPVPLAACLDELGIARISLLVLTHYDLDHVGGLASVLGKVDRAIVGPVADAHDVSLRTSLAQTGTIVEEVSRGDAGVLGDLRWSVLWPPSRLGSIEPGNAASVTVRFEGVGECEVGCLRSMFLGDLGEESQCRMLGASHPAPVDVVKVAHHGSADQCERLYESLHARVGVISVGADNDYGHPTDRLLGILSRTKTTVTRTDQDAMILLSPAPGGGVTVWTER